MNTYIENRHLSSWTNESRELSKYLSAEWGYRPVGSRSARAFCAGDIPFAKRPKHDRGRQGPHARLKHGAVVFVSRFLTLLTKPKTGPHRGTR